MRCSGRRLQSGVREIDGQVHFRMHFNESGVYARLPNN